MKKLLILHTASAKNSEYIASSEELQQKYQITSVNYSDISGFTGPVLNTRHCAVDLDRIDKIWLEFDWELKDSHINYHHITRLVVAKYADKLIVNKKTFQKYHPEYDDKLFVSNLLHYAGIPHPKTRLLSDDKELNDGLVVVKKRFSGRSRDVYLIRDKKELDSSVLANARDYICQEYVDIDVELRVVVYKDAVVAAVKKTSKFKDGVAGKTKIIDEQFNLDDVQSSMCIETARAIESDLLGVDLAVDKAGNSWIIEFNIGATLTQFRKVTGIDVIQDLLLAQN